MRPKTVLISGAGIAGPALAFWLRKAGCTPAIIEQAPALRSGGYVIDFWGLGYDIAERMGLAPAIDRIGYRMRELRIVNKTGDRVAGFGIKVFRELTGGRFVTLRRSDLSRLLFQAIEGETEVIFGDEIAGLEQSADGVEVQFKHAPGRRFDLVIAADGLHSNVRRLVFGPQERFEHGLGYAVAAFEVSGYRPRDEDVYVIYNEPGRMLARFALHEDRTLFLFVFSTGDTIEGAHSLAAQKRVLWERYRGARWECQRILAELDRTESLYFDRVSQIKMDAWSKGRVALVGDAAFCPSLLAGQGSALAMTASYVLAGELSEAQGHHEEAFRRYEARLRPFIASKQKGAERFATAFAPNTRFGLFVRNQAIRATAIPGLAKLTFGRDIIDSLRLPDYGWQGSAAARLGREA